MVERTSVLSDETRRVIYGCVGGAALWALANNVSSVKSSLLAPAVILGGLSARFAGLGELLYPSRPKLRESLLGAVDRRKEVEQPTEWPWCTHGRIEMEWRRDGKVVRGSGSGTLIGSKYVITAAHNLYDRKYGLEYASGYNFTAGLRGGDVAGDDCCVGLSQGSAFELHSLYVNPRKQGEECFYDMAIIELSDDLGLSVGTMGYTAFAEAEDKTVSVTGYPGEYVRSMRMYTMTGSVVRVDAEQIHYDIDTSAGQSGSGVCSTRGTNQYCVAVHAYGGGAYNSATRITKEKFNLVKKWAGK